MDRKEAIKRTALIMGGAVFAPTAMGLLSGCRARPGIDWEPAFFSATQARLVTALAGIILPADERSPGATELGVPAFIEEMIYKVHEEESRQRFLSGLEVFSSLASGQSESRFLELDPEEQFLVAEQHNTRMVEWDDGKLPEELYFFRTMKELTLAGYFTTEVGATQVLQHEAVPGAYDGCVPLEEIGKTWAV